MEIKKLYNSPNVANKIKETAKKRGIVLKELLTKSELGSNTFSHMLHGKSIAFDSLAVIADNLNCSVDFLLGRTEKINGENNEEEALLEAYRSVTEDGKRAIMQQVEYISNDNRYKKFEDVPKEA